MLMPTASLPKPRISVVQVKQKGVGDVRNLIYKKFNKSRANSLESL